jgi:hypothetical protein
MQEHRRVLILAPWLTLGQDAKRKFQPLLVKQTWTPNNNKENLSTCGVVVENRTSRSGFCGLSHISLSRPLAALRDLKLSHPLTFRFLRFLSHDGILSHLLPPPFDAREHDGSYRMSSFCSIYSF